MPEQLLPTTVVGSYPQPDWLVDEKVLKSQTVPRVRLKEMWRVAKPFLEQAQDDATLIAIRDMERAGIDIITDGEMRRESYSNRFATALEGIDIDTPAIVKNRAGVDTVMPRVVGKVRRAAPVEVRDMEFLRRNTDRKAKITLPGPFTMTQQAKNEFYKDQEELAMDFAVAVNEEARDLQKAGADVIQLDEPWLRNDPDAAKRFAVKAINRALEGITVPTVVHLCFGYAFLVSNKPTLVFLSVRACRLQGAADLDRVGAAEDRSRRAEGSVGQEDHARRDQSRRPDRGAARAGRRAHPRGTETCLARSPHPGARLRHEVSGARSRVREAQGAGRRRGDCAERTDLAVGRAKGAKAPCPPSEWRARFALPALQRGITPPAEASFPASADRVRRACGAACRAAGRSPASCRA